MLTNVIVPISKKLMEPAQSAKVSGEGYLASTLMHEISHGLGPAYSRVNGKQIDIREAMGPVFGGLEEAKADVTGMFGLQLLIQWGAMPKDRLEEHYASYVAGIFRTLRFGTGEAHGKAELMEFNVLLENKALSHTSGRYVLDYARMPAALASLAKQLLTFEARGDRAGAEAWFTKYSKVPSELQSALDGTKEIPVDLSPVFAFPDNLR